MAWTQRSSSGKYIGKYRDPDDRVRTAPGGPFTHKAAALRAAGAAEEASRRLGWRSPDAAGRAWGEWCDQWWPTRDVEASTLRADVGRRDRYLAPRWGDVALIDITRHDVKAWAAGLRTPASKGARVPSAATVQRIVHLLSASLNAAVDAEVLDANPAARIHVTGGQSSAERYLTREEFATVCAHLDGPELVMARLLAGTGMRWGEAAGLHRARVDERRSVVEVAEVWSIAGKTIKAYPKGKSNRHVPLPAWVQLAPGARGDDCGLEHAAGRCRGALAVTNRDGGVMDEANFRRAWTRACREAGIGHARIHDLRHSYASWLLQDGIPLAEVGRLLGHKSPLTTQRYAHLAETPSDAVLAALGKGPSASAAAAGRPQLRVVPGGA